MTVLASSRMWWSKLSKLLYQKQLHRAFVTFHCEQPPAPLTPSERKSTWIYYHRRKYFNTISLPCHKLKIKAKSKNDMAKAKFEIQSRRKNKMFFACWGRDESYPLRQFWGSFILSTSKMCGFDHFTESKTRLWNEFSEGVNCLLWIPILWIPEGRGINQRSLLPVVFNFRTFTGHINFMQLHSGDFGEGGGKLKKILKVSGQSWANVQIDKKLAVG